MVVSLQLVRLMNYNHSWIRMNSTFQQFAIAHKPMSHQIQAVIGWFTKNDID